MKNSTVHSIILVSIFLIFLLDSFVFVASAGNVTPTDSNEKILIPIRILNFESPVKLGDFMNVEYYLRDVSGIDDNILVRFSIEKEGGIISSGFDTLFISDVQEKTATAKIFLPLNVESGTYTLNIEADYQGHISKSHRTVEIVVERGFATIDLGLGKLNIVIILVLIILAIFNIYMIFKFEKKMIEKVFLKEEKFIKKHRLSVLTLSFFIILGVLVYCLNLIGFLPKIPLYLYYLFLGILLVLILFLVRYKKHKSK